VVKSRRQLDIQCSLETIAALNHGTPASSFIREAVSDHGIKELDLVALLSGGEDTCAQEQARPIRAPKFQPTFAIGGVGGVHVPGPSKNVADDSREIGSADPKLQGLHFAR
jgi:hypothetical protein